MSGIDIRRAADRFTTRLSWLESHHSFSFGHHHDPANVGHGLLLVFNDDHVAPGGGFGQHGHRDMEIVTWVLEGALEHRDSTGTHGIIRPGEAQRMSAGSGILHSEMNASQSEPVHFLQMWVPPDQRDLEPGYEQRAVSVKPGAGLVAVASGRGHDGAVRINQPHAVMWAAEMEAGEAVVLPDSQHVHAFVARGGVTLSGHDLAAGDAARLTAAGTMPVTAIEPTHLVVWETAGG